MKHNTFLAICLPQQLFVHLLRARTTLRRLVPTSHKSLKQNMLDKLSATLKRTNGIRVANLELPKT